jgi:NAD(P)-dependent dehydrogenase (short-subunit alcohol dehydrogenase family)
MAQGGCLAGKVVVVTGAGRGIGREIALLAAAEGGKVVVNDLGGSAEGEGADTSVAQQVVNEIAQFTAKTGGAAVANGDSVADPLGAERIIKTAIDNFGRVDCVVNNAGILRDRIFHRMSAVDWDAVIKVHLYGAFYMSKAAAPYFKEQESGSFIHFTSTSGLIGNFGQANYAAAKLGIVGLSKSIALDMARFHVRSNCVSPFAWSRLIGTIPVDTPEQKARVERVKNTMTASKIAPICVFLASDLAKDVSGQIFAVRKDEIFLMSQSRPIRVAHKDGGWTPQTLAETVLPAFKSSFYPLDRSQDVFNWEPL